MAISKNKKMLQVALPKDIIDSMDKVCEAISKNLKRKITKSMLITDIYVQWLEFQNKQIEEAEKEEKKNA